MGVFDEVNRMSAAGNSEFRVMTPGGGQLVLLGSFDLDYYHDIEVTFSGVLSSTAPEWMHWPRFAEGTATADAEHRRYAIEDDDGRYEIVARDVAVEIGKVFHYDRGKLLQPGERIAPWVKRKKADGSPGAASAGGIADRTASRGAMKAYVVTTGVVFGLLTVAHLLRMAGENPRLAADPAYIAITAASAALCVWAIWVVRRER
jgi:hypothetical protein